MYPGFIDPKSHQKVFVCHVVLKIETPKLQKLRNQCGKQTMKLTENIDGIEENTERLETNKQDKETNKPDVGKNYIMGSDKFPLDQNRWGFLVPVLQNFFNR